MSSEFAIRAALALALMCQLSLLLPTGGDTTRTEQMMVEVDEKQQEVIDQGLALGKFLGTLLVDAAAILPKVEDGLLTGDVVICNRVPTAGRRR
jgi:hypothetical protein